jgi:hypothetical protein
MLLSNNAFAQKYNMPERGVEPEMLKAPGVERVGSVPLPIQDIQNSNLQQKNFDSSKLLDRHIRKETFETTYVPGRAIYLNGENISSVRNQDLENVHVQIDPNGNIYIDAPQYEVNTEQSYHPLFPKELPKFPKDISADINLPEGVYSKQTGKSVAADDIEQKGERSEKELKVEKPSPMPKELVPEMNSQEKIPSLNVETAKPKG